MRKHISKFYLFLCVAIIALGFVACESESELSESSIVSSDYVVGDELTFDEDEYEEDSGYIVYVTKHGKKYHEEYCRYIKNSESEITEYTVSQALAKGYDSCSVCAPPER